jgi:hypothetical protein
MPSHADALETGVFSAGESAPQWDAQKRRRSYGIWLFTSIGILMVASGIYLLILAFPSHIPYFLSGPVLLFVLGPAIIMVGMWALSGLGPSARTVVVSRELLSLRDIPGRPSVERSWSDPGLRFKLEDLRGLPEVFRSSKTRRPCDYTLTIPGGPETPIPAEAYSAILAEAERHTLRVSRRTINDSRAGGSYVRIDLRAPPSR